MTVELDDTATPESDPARTHTRAASDTGTASGAELPPGLRLGHFRIDKKLGAGGMGEVYLATDLALDRPVAVKVLPSAAASGTARDRLIREARAQARIQHPNVAHIYFIGEDAGRLYFAMEYIAGTSLADRLAAGPLPVEDALAVIRGAVHGLREAQRSGFTHRDVKPSNLMLDAHRIVKVVDFGLVAAVPEHGDGPVEQTTLAGTPLYMAPEQARGEPIDLRADIYALGATLYHLVSGRPPFQAESVAELASLHATAARPAVPRGANPRTAIAAIDTLVTRMMAPDPADRFASYDELLQAIELASVQHSRPAGFWVRAIATGIDALGVAIVTALVGLVVARFGWSISPAILPAAVAVTTFTLGRWGTTPGKALFDLEVVAISTGRRPTWSQAIARQLALGGPTAVLSVIASMLEDAPEQGTQIAIGGGDLFGNLALAMALIALVLLAHAALGVAGKRALWDRLAGTQVRYRVARRDAAALLP